MLTCMEYLELRGYQPKLFFRGRYAQFLCPLQRETNPSFTVYFEDDHWYCFSCHESGDLAGLIAHMEFDGTVTEEVFERRDALNGGIPMGNSFRREEHAQRRESPPASAQQQQFLTALAEFWHLALLEDRQVCTAALAYVEGRGCRDVASHREIGFAPPDTSFWVREYGTFLSRRFGASWLELARSVGLLHGNNTLRLKNRIMFSCFRSNWLSWGYQGRSLIEGQIKYINPQGLYRYPFVVPTTLHDPRMPGTFLVEGAWETEVLHRHGFYATGTLGPDLRLDYASMAEPIYLLHDPDQAGDDQAAKIGLELEKHEKYAIRVRPPADVDEWLRESAEPLLDLLFRQLAGGSPPSLLSHAMV